MVKFLKTCCKVESIIRFIIMILLGIHCSSQKTANSVQVMCFWNIFIANIIFWLYFSLAVLLTVFHEELSSRHYEMCLFLAGALSALCFRNHHYRVVFHRTLLQQ